MRKTISSLAGTIPVIIFIAFWEAAARLAGNQLYPPFSTVVKEFGNLLFASGILLPNFFASFFRVIIGMLLGSGFGFSIGVFMGRNKKIEAFLSPLISILYPIPALGWLPLLMIWLGINELLPVIIVFICSFFPIMYNTLTGVKNVDPSYIKAAKIAGATDRELLWEVIIPLALPDIFTGLRLEAGMAWRVIIAAEMIAIPTGIGVLLMRAESLIRVDIILVCLMVLSLMCYLFERVIVLIEQKITSWR